MANDNGRGGGGNSHDRADLGWEYYLIAFGPTGDVLDHQPDGSDRVYRIRCDKISAHTTLTLFGATEYFAIKNKNENLAPFGKAKPVSWVSLEATFKTGRRVRTRKIEKCSNGSNCQTDESDKEIKD